MTLRAPGIIPVLLTGPCSTVLEAHSVLVTKKYTCTVSAVLFSGEVDVTYVSVLHRSDVRPQPAVCWQQ